MTERLEKIETFLGEFRIIVPGIAALLGFQFSVAFQQGFESLPEPVKLANYAGVLCTAAALAFMVTPAGYHRFTRKLDTTDAFLSFAQRCISAGLLFLSLGLTLGVYVQGVRTVQSPLLPLVPAGGFLALLVVLWWALPWRKARRLDPKAGEPITGAGKG